MIGLESWWCAFWWVIPLLLMFLCCLGMPWRKRSGICGFRWSNSDSRNVSPADSAIDILDKRYALGEIGREEYEERKRFLGHRQDR